VGEALEGRVYRMKSNALGVGLVWSRSSEKISVACSLWTRGGKKLQEGVVLKKLQKRKGRSICTYNGRCRTRKRVKKFPEGEKEGGEHSCQSRTRKGKGE